MCDLLRQSEARRQRWLTCWIKGGIFIENHFINPIFENIWKERYCKNGESYDENLLRVADFCGNAHWESSLFYNVMKDGLFFPGGRTMSNSGIGNSLTLNNCFVAPQIADDLETIFETVKLGAMTHQRGGGIGFDFSLLRPNGTPTANDAVASGPVSFASVFNAQTATILQGGRRGANMGVLNIYHPDIREFIHAKSYETGTLNHFNLSVMVDDAFMDAAENRKEIVLHWPVYDGTGKIITDPTKWQITKTVNAGELWDEIMRMAYENGEPGIFFYDNMNRDNNLAYEETIVCSNPCAEYLAGTVYGGELPSQQYGGACNLGSLMLQNFVKNPFQEDAYIAYDELAEAIKVAVRFLDNIIDVNKFPSKIYENYQTRYRTIGLGYTGLADALVMIGHEYNSVWAREKVDYLADFIALHAYKASIELAKEKGSFPGFDAEKFVKSGFLIKHTEDDGRLRNEWIDVVEDIKKYGIRNAKLLSVAPTGTMSLTFGNNCSSGIEPIFSLEYDRRVKIGGQSEENIQTVTVKDYAYGLYDFMKNCDFPVVENPPFVTALEMSVEDHIKMLATIAYHVDMSVSKTINVPEDYPFEKCKDIYKDCWNYGIKGCTIFRPNPLRQGVLVEKKDEKTPAEKPAVQEMNRGLQRGDVIDCDDSLIGVKRKLTTGCGSMHVMAWYDPVNGDIMEVFIGKGSSGGCEKNLTAMTRLVSASLRGGVPFDYVMDQLESCGGCTAYKARQVTAHDTSPGSSCATAIAKALKEMQKTIYADIESDVDFEEAETLTISAKEIVPIVQADKHKCPECGEDISFEGGCNICKSCGWSKCG